MIDSLILAVAAAVISAGVSGIISGTVLMARMKVYLEWFKAEVIRIDHSTNRAHERIDNIDKGQRR